MQHKRLTILLISAGFVALVITGIALASPQPVKAQCGSQASSCKNCHETQAKDPVNNDGKAWHQSHAFGDFCYICHGGNNQATDKTAAHAGLVAPLSDVNASCKQCHPNDLQARAQVYASALGVTVGSGSTTSATPAPTTAAPTSETPVGQSQPVAAQAPAPSSNNANLTDYVLRYNEKVLGQQPINWGNIIAIIIVVALLLGGGFLVNRREGWISVSFKEKKPLDKEYPADVADIASRVAQLKPASRKSLRNLLGKPRATAEFLSAIDTLSEEDSPEEES
jgi:hypothetical protein